MSPTLIFWAGVKGGLDVRFSFAQVKTWIKGWITKADVGLGNVNNTADASKPISTATQNALDLKADISSLGTAAAADTTDFATAAQGGLADTAVQPGDLTPLAPLDSPEFIGTPTAPTASPGNNSEQIATTEYVDNAVTGGVSGVASLNGQTGALVFVSPPQGRLTLVSGVPVMTTTQSAKTTLYYTPYVGNQLPIHDGTNMIPTAFAEISVETTDTAKNPAAIGASKVNDWFVWNDGGTLRLSHGPDWTDDTTRSAGTALARVNGILLNAVAITNGPGAERGTYVGTTRSNASSQLDHIFGSKATGGGAAFFGVWNAYNRVPVGTTVSESADSWTYNVAAWRAANGSSTYRVSMVRGLDEDVVQAEYSAYGIAGSASGVGSGVGVDTTTAFSGTTALNGSPSVSQSLQGIYTGLLGIGLHYVSAIEYNTTTTAGTWYGDLGVAYVQTGLHATLRF